MSENLLSREAMQSHGSCSDLAETDTMSPTMSAQQEGIGLLLDIEPRTEQMATGQRLADQEFLADGEGALTTHNLQLLDSTRSSTLQRFNL